MSGYRTDEERADDYDALQNWRMDAAQQEWDEACERSGYCQECNHMGMHHEACPNAEQPELEVVS